jgi:hypothetical protein
MVNKQTAVESLREALDTELKAGTKMVVNWDMYLKMEEDQTRDFTIHNLKRQKQLHQDLINKHLMEQELKNTMTEKTNITDNDSNIQTQLDSIWTRNWTEIKPNNTTWTQIKLWTLSVMAVIMFFGCIYLLATNKTAVLVFLTMVGVGVIIGLVMGTKILIESAYNEIMENRK